MPAEPREGKTTTGVLLGRYGLSGGLVLAGVVCLLVAPEGQAFHGFALFTGAGVSLLLLNVLYRIGVRGDFERDDEEEARRYFTEHGEWPDAGPPKERAAWRLPEGVATPESEEAEKRRRPGASEEQAGGR